MKTRDELLSQQTFPAAPEACVSLARWTGAAGWVAGQVAHVQSDAFVLTSAQSRSVEFKVREPFPIQAGDHVAIQVSGERPAFAEEIRVLFVGELPPPPRHRQDWRPFVRSIHDFFIQSGFVEVETPTLVHCPGLEPALEPFHTELRRGTRIDGRYLPTSPEIHLKKALCLGWTDIYEIKSCFRNGEFSQTHQPEFTMLEWYRAYSGLDAIIRDVGDLLEHIGASRPSVTTFADIFMDRLGLRLTPSTSSADLREWCRSLEIECSADDTATDLFHRIWLDRIESELKGVMIIRDFPPDQAALARIKTDGWADRFELFWNGVEIANAFHEVNDPDEQIQRWAGEIAERRRLGRTSLPPDDELVALMRRHGLPPTGGIALGVERLFMLSRGIDDIRRLRPFSY